MFCSQCGTEMQEDSLACPRCGRSTRVPAIAGGTAAQLRDQLAVSSRDAAGALRALSLDPVSGLPTAYQSLGPRAFGAGAALAVFFSLAGAIGASLAARRAFVPFLGIGGQLGIGGFFKLLLSFLVLPTGLALACFAIRKVLGSAPGLSVDILTAGAALAPLGVTLLLGGILGMANLEVILLLLLFAFVYLVLILHSGLTKAGALRERASAPAVPVVLILALWLSKVVFVALMRTW